MNNYEELKRVAKFNQHQSAHFGVPAAITVPPTVILELIADAERMDWIQAAYGGHGNEAGFHLSMFIDGASEIDDLREMVDGAIAKEIQP